MKGGTSRVEVTGIIAVEGEGRKSNGFDDAVVVTLEGATTGVSAGVGVRVVRNC